MTVKELIDKLEDPAGDVLKENDIKRFIKDIENVNVGSNYARIKAEDKIWEGLGICSSMGQIWTKEVNSINVNGLYVICKAGSNRAGFI